MRYTPLKQFSSYPEAYDFLKTEEVRPGLVEERRPLFEAGFARFYPQFTEHFQYHSYFVSMKTKVRDASANRQAVIKTFGHQIHVMSGKINTLFEAEDA